MSPVALCFSVFGGCLVGSLVPLVNTELIVLTAAAAAPRSLLVPIILIAAATQIAAKCLLYHAGSGLLRLPRNRYTARVHDALAGAHQLRKAGSLTLFVSASTGFPPFYLTSIAAGAVRTPFAHFVSIGFIGRLLRFTALVLLPQAVKAAL